MRIFHGQEHCQSKQYANYEELQVVELADDSYEKIVAPIILSHSFVRQLPRYVLLEDT